MSTRCFIGIRASNDEIVGIYNHHDGYPSHVGAILKKHYDTARKTWVLIGMGNRSTLHENLEESLLYDGDGESPQIWDDEDDVFCHNDYDYIYVFQKGNWYFARWDDHKLKLLTDKVIEED